MIITQYLPIFDRALVPGPIFVTIELTGQPGHKGRHRSRIVKPRGRMPFIHNYPDPETEAYEQALAQTAKLCMRGKVPTENPVAVLVEAIRSPPASWSLRDRTAAVAGFIRPTSKPDSDNHLKILDALNKIVWNDDAQIVDARIIKIYSEQACLRIEVRELIAAV